MISLDKLMQSISNLNEKELRLPDDNKFTQRTIYQHLKDELLANKNELNEITPETVDVLDHFNKFNLPSKDENLNKEISDDFVVSNDNLFDLNSLQSLSNYINPLDDLLLNHKDEENKQSEDLDSLMIYNENDTVDLPEIISKILSPYQNNFYLYGFKNPNSLAKSIKMLYESDFILKSKSEKENEAVTFIREMAVQLDTFYKKYNYKKLKLNKNEMLEKLLNNNHSYATNLYISDYIKNNYFILNITDKTYKKYTHSDSDFYFAVIYYDNTYLPLMNSNGNHYINKQIIDNIEQYFHQFNDYDNCVFRNPEIINKLNKNDITNDITDENAKSTEMDVVSCNRDVKSPSNGKKTLKELQELASSKNINIKKKGKSGKMINKTKKELEVDLEIN